jgi:hypothetical protein
VTAIPSSAVGRTALRVEITDAVTLKGTPNVAYIDMPTFVIIPVNFEDGTIEVDILSRLNGKGPTDARALPPPPIESPRMPAASSRFMCVHSTGGRPTRPGLGTRGQFNTSPTPAGGMRDSGNTTRTAATNPAPISAPMSGSM